METIRIRSFKNTPVTRSKSGAQAQFWVVMDAGIPKRPLRGPQHEALKKIIIILCEWGARGRLRSVEEPPGGL